MRKFGAEKDAVPLPPSAPGWFDQEHHLAAEQVGGQSTEHPLGEEAGMVLEGLKDPFVVKGSRGGFLFGLPVVSMHSVR